MNLKQALERIEQLERRVKELEARPPQQHFHYHNQPPVFQPIQPPLPLQPLQPPFEPIPWRSPVWYEVTCGSGRQQ